MPSKTKNKIRDAIRMVLDDNRGRPLDCERIMTTINGNLEHYNVKKIKDSKSIQNAVYRKDCTDLEMKNRLVYIVEGSNIIENNRVITENNPDECFNEWERSNIKISITKDLRDKIDTDGINYFCHGIQNINDLLNNWYADPLVSEILGNSRRKLKVILGTCEEVIELRNEFYGIYSSELDHLKLKIINHISSKNTCKNIPELDKLYEQFKIECINFQDSFRYAYYVPQNCGGGIEGYPVLLCKENNSNCKIYDEIESWDSDFIVMPYDVKPNSRVILSPNFYQALYHELYHFLVINNYRCSGKINEGSPEVYSEICYKQFLSDFIRRELADFEISEFYEEYMQFCYSGSYKPYYDYVKNKMLDSLILSRNGSIPYDKFCKFVLDLIRYSVNNRPNCKDPTPDCGSTFKVAINNMISEH